MTNLKGEQKKIGELLIEAGYITAQHVDQALRIQRSTGERICSILIDLGHLSEENFLEFLSQTPGMASVDISSIKIEDEVMNLVPEEVARRLELVPIGQLGSTVTVAMVYPLDEKELQELENIVGMKVRPVLCARSAILDAIESHFEREKKKFRVEGDEGEDLSAFEGPLKLTRIARLIQEIKDLPTLPDILNKVSAVINDPNSSAADLAKVVSSDGSLSGKLLRLANSPAYGFSRKISDIQHAIALLGFAETQSLAISVSVFDELSNKADFDYQGHWNHSLACATLARMISTNLKVGGMETAFTAGLLHDVGKVLLAIKMGGKQNKVNVLFSSSTGMTKLETEQKILGITHAEVGYLLAEHWLLPSVVTEAIRYHHSPEFGAESRVIANIVYLANLYCEAAQFAESIVFDDPIMQSLGIIEVSEEAFRNTLQAYSQIAAELDSLG